MGYKSIYLSLVLGLLCLSAPLRAIDLIVYTEDYPPYNYMDEAGEVQGLATDKVRQVLDATGTSYEIRIVPWARAVNSVLSKENALIYTITRIPSREDQYDWLVPVGEGHFYLFARAEEIRTVTKEGLRAGAFTTACVATDLTCDLLKGMGLPPKNIVAISTAGTGDFRLVVANRADFYLSELAVNRYLRKQEGFSVDITKPVYRMERDTDFYMASGQRMPKMVRDHIRSTYEGLREAGDYTLINSADLQEK